MFDRTHEPDGNSPAGGDRLEQPVQEGAVPASIRVMQAGPATHSIDAFLERHGVREANRSRLAESIVNPRLIASIMIIESRGNPFAISGKDAIGIMQNMPTWGQTADREGINLLKIETTSISAPASLRITFAD
jgi:Transglycosylase SLT domain